MLTPQDIIEGISVPATDWRAPYQGQTIDVYAFATPSRASDPLTIDTDRIVPVFLAMPRDREKQGAEMRARGMLAIHWNYTEDGKGFLGEPQYLTASELASIWPSDGEEASEEEASEEWEEASEEG